MEHWNFGYRLLAILLTLVASGSGFASANRLPRRSEDLRPDIVMVATLSAFRQFAVSPTRDSGLHVFDQANQADGQKLFQTRCFVCHGRDGKGDGPSATGLAEKPQDLTDANWQRTTTDDRIRSVIQGGGAAIGKTGAMPPNPDLNQEQVLALTAYIRSLGASGH
jgi:cytochrome c